MKRTRALIPLVVAILGVSCGQQQGEPSPIRKAGEKVGETITEFGSGVGAGVDSKMTVPVELGASLAEKGLSRTVAKSIGFESSKKGFSVYLVAKEAAKLTLVAKAYNKSGEEIGRAKTQASFEVDDAKYVTFEFAPEMDSATVAKYVIDLGR